MGAESMANISFPVAVNNLPLRTEADVAFEGAMRISASR